jgi:6-phosphogluconate dehydrogenase
VAGYDIDAEKVKAFGTKYPGKHLIACRTLEEFLAALERPRRIMMMVPAGKPVDAAITSIKPILEQGDLLIDGGNTLFTDTERRSAELATQASSTSARASAVANGRCGDRPSCPAANRRAWDW